MPPNAASPTSEAQTAVEPVQPLSRVRSVSGPQFLPAPERLPRCSFVWLSDPSSPLLCPSPQPDPAKAHADGCGCVAEAPWSGEAPGHGLLRRFLIQNTTSFPPSNASPENPPKGRHARDERGIVLSAAKGPLIHGGGWWLVLRVDARADSSLAGRPCGRVERRAPQQVTLTP